MKRIILVFLFLFCACDEPSNTDFMIEFYYMQQQTPEERIEDKIDQLIDVIKENPITWH